MNITDVIYYILASSKFGVGTPSGRNIPKHVGVVKHYMVVSVICAFVWSYKRIKKELQLESRL